MTKAPHDFDFRKLSVPERILLVEEIWDSVAEDQQLLELTESQREELHKRLRDYRQNPTEGSTWEEVRARIRK